MSGQSWVQTIALQRAAGTLFNTYTTAKSVINPDALVVLPANYLVPGAMLHIFAAGGISNIVTTPGLMNFQVKMGPTANIAVFDTGNIQLNATAHTLLPFWIDIYLTCRTIGNATTANFMGQAQVCGKMFTFTAAQIDDLQDMPTILGPATAPAVGTGFDSTTASILDFWVGFTISAAGNGIQIQQYRVTSLT